MSSHFFLKKIFWQFLFLVCAQNKKNLVFFFVATIWAIFFSRPNVVNWWTPNAVNRWTPNAVNWWIPFFLKMHFPTTVGSRDLGSAAATGTHLCQIIPTQFGHYFMGPGIASYCNLPRISIKNAKGDALCSHMLSRIEHGKIEENAKKNKVCVLFIFNNNCNIFHTAVFSFCKT